MNKIERELGLIIRDTEKQLGKFLNTFYENIENLKDFDKNPVVEETLEPLKVFWGKNKIFRLGGIFLWNDIDKEHIFSGDFFSEELDPDHNEKIKNWLFIGEKKKDIELLVKFVLKEWKNKKKVIQITTDKKTEATDNNSDLIDLICLKTCNRKMRKQIPKLIKQYGDYSGFFKDTMVNKIVEKCSCVFKKYLQNRIDSPDGSTISPDEISMRLAKNIALLMGYDKKWKHIYIIPALIYVPTLKGEVIPNYPTGGLFIGVKKRIPKEMLFLFKLFIFTISSHIALIYQNREIASHSLRSAISAIMGRNMSHNIGSHVLARISTGGIDGWTANKKIKEIIDDLYGLDSAKIKEIIDVLNGLVGDKIEKIKNYLRGLDNNKKREDIIHWSKDIQFLSRYIQQRMDFIAQIATDWPTWTEPALLMNDLMRWFLSQKHLLNNIAASEGLKAHLFPGKGKENPGEESRGQSSTNPKENERPGDIRFHVFLVPENCWGWKGDKTSDNPVEKRMNFLKQNSKDPDYQTEKNLKCVPNADSSPTQNCNYCKSCRRILLFTPGTGEAHCRLDEDIPIAIPGGIIGYHAFYILLENIIRNGAKHDYTKGKGHYDHFDVVIEILYDPDEKIAVSRKEEKKIIPALLFRIYNNTSKIENGLDNSMNNLLRTSIITNTGELNKGNWGLSEMKIAAGFLQQRDIGHIGDGKERVTGEETDNFKTLGEDINGSDTIMRAVESPIGTLGYEFYIPKPRTVGIVCRKGIEEKEGKLGEG